MLSRQIAGLPIDEAIVQMQFSEKRASKWIKSTLCLARDHAMDKGLSRDKMIVGTSASPVRLSGGSDMLLRHPLDPALLPFPR